MTRRWMRVLSLCGLFVWGAVAPAAAQRGGAAPLPPFVARIASGWAGADADALAAMMPRGGRVMLDLGTGTAGAVEPRHAQAALRALFAEYQTAAVTVERATLAGGAPMRGFAEIAWSARMRGVSTPRARTVFVGLVWDGSGWRIDEIRLRPGAS